MNIQRFDDQQVSVYEDDIRNLLCICMEHNFSDSVPRTFYDEKIASLKHYLQEGQAFLFGAQEDEHLAGILWGCVMNTIAGQKFHVLYFAVYPEFQSTGTGTALLQAAEAEAVKLGIPQMELLVTADNARGVRFYEKNAYETVRLVLEKRLTI